MRNKTNKIDEMLVEWMTPEEIRNTDVGLSYEEHIEMAYENVVSAYYHIQRQNIQMRRENKIMKSALEFYANPDTYFAIMIMGDPPCGAFIDDFSKCYNNVQQRPGKRARAALKAGDE